MKLCTFLAALGLRAVAAAQEQTQLPAHPQRPWNEDIIYFAVTDRFFDGDAENNLPTGSDPVIFDAAQQDIDRYHGGDLRGLERALQTGYFTRLGVTALWITPPVRNVWYSRYDMSGAKTGYHGYWAQDFLDVDPHLVSRRSLDGTRAYADTRDGRMQHYKDFVALAHGQGIKIVQDIVCNHAGPVFYYDINGNEQFDVDRKDEWIAPYKHDGFYESARWAENPQWDQHRAEPAGPQTIFGRAVKTRGVFGRLESYGRKGMSRESLGKTDGEEIACDFFGLRDFWTAPGSAQFDQLVDDFVEVYAFYVEAIGVDGFRIDTVKHVHHAFWDAFTERLRQRLGPERARQLILFGEVYDGSAAKSGSYTFRSDWPLRREPCLDSVLHFPFCFAVRSYLRTKDAPFGSARAVENALRDLTALPKPGAAHAFYNPAPGLDGLNAAQKSVNFIENHDSLNRFRVQGVSAQRNLLANALMLTAPGIPCLYYGTEAALEDTRAKIGDETETGRMTFLPASRAGRLGEVEKSASFEGLAALCALRRQLPALTSGAVSPLWVDSGASEADDGVFAFARGEGADVVIVAFNASDKERVTGTPDHAMKLVSFAGKPLLIGGEKLEPLPVASFPKTSAASRGPLGRRDARGRAATRAGERDDFPKNPLTPCLHFASSSSSRWCSPPRCTRRKNRSRNTPRQRRRSTSARRL